MEIGVRKLSYRISLHSGLPSTPNGRHLRMRTKTVPPNLQSPGPKQTYMIMDLANAPARQPALDAIHCIACVT